MHEPYGRGHSIRSVICPHVKPENKLINWIDYKKPHRDNKNQHTKPMGHTQKSIQRFNIPCNSQKDICLHIRQTHFSGAFWWVLSSMCVDRFVFVYLQDVYEQVRAFV